MINPVSPKEVSHVKHTPQLPYPRGGGVREMEREKGDGGGAGAGGRYQERRGTEHAPTYRVNS